jgi:hypothetical protein
LIAEYVRGRWKVDPRNPLPSPVGASATQVQRWLPAAVVCGLYLIFWLAVVKSTWVRRAAENYADRLLGAIDVLASQGLS